MALSLADELASAFDDETGGLGGLGGAGMSLAEEFGLDMGVEGDEHGEDQGEGEVIVHDDGPSTPPNGNLPLPQLSPFVHKNGTVRGTPRQIRHRSSIKNLMPSSGSPQVKRGGDDGDGRDELVSEYLSIPGTEFGLPNDDGERLHEKQGIWREVDKVDMGVGRSFLGCIPHKDNLAILNEILESNKPFLRLLINLNEPSKKIAISTSSTSSDRSANSMTGTSRTASRDIEVLLQTHLDRLHDSDRIREEQSRELQILMREFGRIRWEGMNLDMDDFAERDMVFNVDGQGKEGQEELGSIGWIGEPSTLAYVLTDQLSGEGIPPPSASLDLVSPISPNLLHPYSHTHLSAIPISPHASTSFLPWTAHTSLSTDASHPHASRYPSTATLLPLPQTTNLLHTTTFDLLSSLSSLSESLHSAMSFTTSKARQVRGIKASIDSWREREIVEKEAREGIEIWERSRLENGLSGKPNNDIADRLRTEMREFAAVLDGLQKTMEEVRRDTKFRLALV